MCTQLINYAVVWKIADQAFCYSAYTPLSYIYMYTVCDDNNYAKGLFWWIQIIYDILLQDQYDVRNNLDIDNAIMNPFVDPSEYTLVWNYACTVSSRK